MYNLFTLINNQKNQFGPCFTIKILFTIIRYIDRRKRSLQMSTQTSQFITVAIPQAMSQAATQPLQTIVNTSQQAVKQDVQHRHWNSNLCDCCIDCSSCCLGFMCPCVAFCKIVKHVNNDKQSCCDGCCKGLCCCVLPFSVCLRAPYRKQLRIKYNLPAKPCNDCCVTLWCPCCALAQEMREIKFQQRTSSAPPSLQTMQM